MIVSKNPANSLKCFYSTWDEGLLRKGFLYNTVTGDEGLIRKGTY